MSFNSQRLLRDSWIRSAQQSFLENSQSSRQESQVEVPQEIAPQDTFTNSRTRTNMRGGAEQGSAKSLATSGIWGPGLSPGQQSPINSLELALQQRRMSWQTTQVQTAFPVQTVRQPQVLTPTNPLPPLQVDPKDWHIPALSEVFELAKKYPGKQIVLDCKLPPSDPQTATRLANQIMELCKKSPEMRDRIIVMCPNADDLNAMKAAFAKNPEWKNFKNFTLDNENLNKLHPSESERSPLTDSGDNRYVSIGRPANPLLLTPMKRLEEEIAKARKAIDDPSPNNPNRGKKILVWTLNDQDEIRRAVKAGADGILTDDPDALNRTLDSMGYAKDDPKRPQVIAHRGGPNSGQYPENTLPAIEQGLRRADAIEIDLVSAKDGVLVFHDNDPTSLVGIVRNAGLETGNAWRPTYPGFLSKNYGKTLNELSMDEIRGEYGFEPQLTSSVVANAAFGAASFLLRLPGAILHSLGKFIKPLEWVGQGVEWLGNQARSVVGWGIKLADKVVTGLWRGVTKVGETIVDGAKKVVNGAWEGVKSAAKSVGNFFKKLF